MAPVMAGFFGFGMPEVMSLVVLALVIYGVSRLLRRPGFSRFCPKCGRGLTQPADAPFCSYCGNHLP